MPFMGFLLLRAGPLTLARAEGLPFLPPASIGDVTHNGGTAVTLCSCERTNEDRPTTLRHCLACHSNVSGAAVATFCTPTMATATFRRRPRVRATRQPPSAALVEHWLSQAGNTWVWDQRPRRAIRVPAPGSPGFSPANQHAESLALPKPRAAKASGRHSLEPIVGQLRLPIDQPEVAVNLSPARASDG